jgi:hypothetical protein
MRQKRGRPRRGFRGRTQSRRLGGRKGSLEPAVVTALAKGPVPAGKSGTGLFHRLSHLSLLKVSAFPNCRATVPKDPGRRCDRRHTLAAEILRQAPISAGPGSGTLRYSWQAKTPECRMLASGLADWSCRNQKAVGFFRRLIPNRALRNCVACGCLQRRDLSTSRARAQKIRREVVIMSQPWDSSFASLS